MAQDPPEMKWQTRRHRRLLTACWRFPPLTLGGDRGLTVDKWSRRRPICISERPHCSGGA
eukprot:7423438-Alexandrium_andersonii.AAC.1